MGLATGLSKIYTAVRHLAYKAKSGSARVNPGRADLQPDPGPFTEEGDAMSMEMKQSLKMTQQMVMTPQLQMAIKLLQVSRMELVEQVQEEMKENPLLEDTVDTQAELSREDPIARDEQSMLGETERPVDQPAIKEPTEADKEVPTEGTATDIDWSTFLENSATAPSMPSGGRADSEELPSLEQTLTRRVSLTEHLMRQLHMAQLPPDEEACASLIIGNLDTDGYFKEPPLEEIAQEVEVELAVAERALHRLQRFDPWGCGARTLQESLLVQAEMNNIDDEVLVKMLTEHLGDLEKRNFARIAHKLKVDIEEVYEAAKDIQRLDPRPGREYITEQPQYITPDVTVVKLGEQYFVQANDDGLPKLKISKYYLEMMKTKGKEGRDKDTEEEKKARDYVQERLRSAKWLIDSIAQRQRTIVKVTESILKFQHDFFEKGISYLKPLVLRDVANDIGMHESTISRATSNKYVHTSQGLFELKYFFNEGINREDGGEEIASEAVRRFIKTMVMAEDSKKPYSDQKLVELLSAQHKIDIARRTVAKYREQMGILPSAQRKKSF
jgi:RNA polymerase sigma-54 factor